MKLPVRQAFEAGVAGTGSAAASALAELRRILLDFMVITTTSACRVRKKTTTSP